MKKDKKSSSVDLGELEKHSESPDLWQSPHFPTFCELTCSPAAVIQGYLNRRLFYDQSLWPFILGNDLGKIKCQTRPRFLEHRLNLIICSLAHDQHFLKKHINGGCHITSEVIRHFNC